MKKQTYINPDTLRKVLELLNLQQGYIDDGGPHGLPMSKYDLDMQASYVDGLQRMLDYIISDNYTDVSRHVYFDGRDRKWYVEGVQL